MHSISMIFFSISSSFVGNPIPTLISHSISISNRSFVTYLSRRSSHRASPSPSPHQLLILNSKRTPFRTMSDKISLTYSQDRAMELKENLDDVLREISSTTSNPVRLVAVSKLKPISDIKALYDAGHRHFGENYIQELLEKSLILPSDINWHFIGSLQSNKAKVAASIPNLYVLETLSSIKAADLLQKALSSSRPNPLRVFLQVNTSQEESKSGLSPLDASSGRDSDLFALAFHISQSCPALTIAGLMTIGSWDASHDAETPNPDFASLKESKIHLERLLSEAGITMPPLELSMGMSADYIQAVREGSNSVRVGTKIFGERPKKNK